MDMDITESQLDLILATPVAGGAGSTKAQRRGLYRWASKYKFDHQWVHQNCQTREGAALVYESLRRREAAETLGLQVDPKALPELQIKDLH